MHLMIPLAHVKLQSDLSRGLEWGTWVALGLTGRECMHYAADKICLVGE